MLLVYSTTRERFGYGKGLDNYPDGHENDITHESFLPMWSMFQKISKRYHEAKVLFETYTLEEVIDIFSGCN